MLKLKKLQIQGFKSFCERTELQFPGAGVVGIVGPNGCGKSNLADAISWVLGEQSAKSLRGGRMEDVIFAGTRDRAATGMAEVSLTFVDPSEYALGVAEAGEPRPEPEILTPGWDDGDNEAAQPEAQELEEESESHAPASGAVILTIRKRRKFRAHNRRGEILVTRRLYRDGQSEYLMNGRPCRLRDIQDLFLGTGLGPESYAIIEQGRIGQILSSRPYDRRAILEEAAGVSKYKAKRRLAEARLEAARQNLARINDIFEEVTRQVASLKRQSAKAEHYRQYKQEFDARLRQLLRLRATAMAAAASGLAARRAELQAAVAAAEAEVAALESARLAVQVLCQSQEERLRAAGESAARLRHDCDHTRQQITYDLQQAEDLDRRAAENTAAQSHAVTQRQSLECESAQARRDRESAAQSHAAARERWTRAQQAHATAGAEEAAAAAAAESVRAGGLDLLRLLGACANQIALEEVRLQELDRLLERLGRDAAAARTELEASGARRGQLQLEFQEQEAEAAQLRLQVAELEADVTRLAAAAATNRAQEQEARTRLAAAAARRTSLEEIVAGHGYSSEAVQRLFSSGSLAASGVLGEFIEAEPPYEHLVEQFLHDELNYVVVTDWQQAGAGVDMLRSAQTGRATFLVHSAASVTAGVPAAGQAAGLPAPAAPPVMELDAVPLLDHMRALNGFRGGLGALLPRLRDAYAVSDAEQARRLAERHPHAYFLTPEGACYHRGTLSGGSGRGAGPLSLKRELRQLRQQEEEFTAAAAHQGQQALVLTRQAEGAQQQREQQRTRLHELDARRLSGALAVRQLEQEQARAQARLQQALLESGRTQSSRTAAAERLDAARAQTAHLHEEQTAQDARHGEAAAALTSAQSARATAAAALGESHAGQARAEERAAAAAAAAGRLQSQADELTSRLQSLRREGDDLSARAVERRAAAASGQHQAAALAHALTAAEQSQSAAAAALAAARAGAQQADEALRQHRPALDAHRQALSENDVARARLDAEQEHLRAACRDDLGCEIEQLLSLPEPEDAASDLPTLEETVRTLRQRIEHLGPINMMALEEYEEARQRFELMDTQRRDLLDSIADTQKAIQELDDVSRQKFQEAFEQINEFFQESFRVLFGGGQGFLRLDEADPGAEMGVDIVAQPPGKKLQNALLLSGGEKAMTAMALLLAIFRYQPSPFCLLDEVDAPMDEANVTRFADMVRTMSAETQFILITHNKRTMESAGTLYGVTMPQPGCSRLVSVMMEEGERAAAAS
ncbi:MAG: chromosome segregation protein SMC [Terriglobales bacterium]